LSLGARLYMGEVQTSRLTPLNRIRNVVFLGLSLVICLALAIVAIPRPVRAWNEDQFERRPLFAYPLPRGRDNIVGDLVTYRIQKGDTLLDVGRWFGLSSAEISNANNHLDWWAPPAGTKIILPDEHILPDAPRTGIVLNIPEMRLYYYPLLRDSPNRKGKITPAAFKAENLSPENGTGRTGAQVVYTFPVGLGRFDWKTPIGNWRVRGKTKEPTWVVPEDIYEEHLERDGEAEHVVPGGGPDNPLGHYWIENSRSRNTRCMGPTCRGAWGWK
jgi:lipoprotein-anchoring transpeptidase ErfK/SrfK